MKAVFCCLNSKYIHSSLAPWCLLAACKKHCCNEIGLKVIEGTVNEPQSAVIERIFAEKPDVLLLSCYIWNITASLSLCKAVKSIFPTVKTVVGGPEVSYIPGEILKSNPMIDFVSSGAGEASIPMLLNSLYKKTDESIPGISHRNDSEICIDTREPATDESTSPYCEEYFRSLAGRIAYIESSRGCPFSCAFCLSGRIGKVRYIDLDRVKNEMLLLSQAGAKTVKFVDRTFNCNKERAKEILEFIRLHHGKEIPDTTCFHFEIAADLLDDSLFAVIEKLPQGSVQFEVGIQSFHEATLKAIHRKTDLEKVENNISKLLSFCNCHVHIDLIAGLPEENYDSFVAGFNKAYHIGANMLQLGFLKILHGSPMAEHRELYPCNHCQEPPYEVIETPWITQEELQKLHTAENELDRLYNSGRFRRTLNYVLSAAKCSPFALFFGVGTYLQANSSYGSIPLDTYTNLIFDYFSALDGIDKMHLRNTMLYDRIATNSSTVIPEKLKITDPNLKKYKMFLKEENPPKKGTNRTVAILYGENKVIYCDHLEKNKVSGEYKVTELPISKFEQ